MVFFEWGSVNLNCNGLLTNTKKYLLRAAKIELLVAEATSHPAMIEDRVKAYSRATSYYSGVLTC